MFINRRLWKVIFVILGFLLMVNFFYVEAKKQHKIDKAGLEDLNFQLIGVVDSVDKGENFHAYGIIRLRILKSNIKEYDPRPKQQFYFCVIKNGIAEIYDHASLIAKGDTLIYNTKEKMGGYLRNGRKYQYGSISINSDDSYWNYIHRHQKI